MRILDRVMWPKKCRVFSVRFIPVVLLIHFFLEWEIGTRFQFSSVELWQIRIRSHALQVLHLAAHVRESETKARHLGWTWTRWGAGAPPQVCLQSTDGSYKLSCLPSVLAWYMIVPDCESWLSLSLPPAVHGTRKFGK
jgi:hypothetical protein